MRLPSFALLAVAALMGCNAQPTRSVSGQLRVDTSSMTRPVVIAQSSDHRTFVASVTASGRFTLQLPASASYRLSLASTAASGVYTTKARINWPLQSGASRWATLGDGGAITLGAVFERGSTPSARDSEVGDDDHGDDDHGDCHEDDHSCSAHGGEVDDDCDHQMSSGDHCDEDDDADEHEQQANEDECKGDGGSATGGGGDTGAGGIG
jgi:hypothetical protein